MSSIDVSKKPFNKNLNKRRDDIMKKFDKEFTLEKCCQVMTNDGQDQSNSDDSHVMDNICFTVKFLEKNISELKTDGLEEQFIRYYDKIMKQMLKVDAIKEPGHHENKQKELIQEIKQIIEDIRVKSFENLKNMYHKIEEKGVNNRLGDDLKQKCEQYLKDETNAKIRDTETLRYKLNDLFTIDN